MKPAILAAALTLSVVSEAQSQSIPQRDIFTKSAAVSDLGNQINYSVGSILPPPTQGLVVHQNNNIWNTTEKVVNKIDSFIDPLFRETTDLGSIGQQSVYKYNPKKIGDVNGWNIQKESRNMNFGRDRSLLVGYSFLLSDKSKTAIRMDTGVQFKKSTTAGLIPIMNHTSSNVGVLIRLNIETK